MKKYIIFSIINLIVLYCVSCFGPQVKESSVEENSKARIYTENERKIILLTYSNIPLNKDFTTFTSELSKLIDIEKSEIPYVAIISQYKISNLFDGLYERTDSLSQGYDDELFLNTAITKKYYYSLWNLQISESISDISIFTYKSNVDSKEIIFMIIKELKNISVNYKSRLDGMVSGMSKEIGFKPKIYETNFQNNVHLNSNTHEPAYVAIWDTSKTKILLLIRNDGFGNSSEGSIIYISNLGWSNYLKGCKNVEKEKTKRNEKFSDGF